MILAQAQKILNVLETPSTLERGGLGVRLDASNQQIAEALEAFVQTEGQAEATVDFQKKH